MLFKVSISGPEAKWPESAAMLNYAGEEGEAGDDRERSD